MRQKSLKLTSIISLLFMLTACFTTRDLDRRITKPLAYRGGKPAPKTDVHKAILQACQDRHWVCKSVKGDSAVDGMLRVRSHKLSVEISYSGTNIEFKYLSSENLRESGGKIHKKYYIWLDAFTRSVNKHL